MKHSYNLIALSIALTPLTALTTETINESVTLTWEGGGRSSSDNSEVSTRHEYTVNGLTPDTEYVFTIHALNPAPGLSAEVTITTTPISDNDVQE